MDHAAPRRLRRTALQAKVVTHVPPKLTVGSCFSGIGGLELGLEWTGGFETRWQIENDEYASRVLARHWPEVKRYGDITTVGGGQLEPVDVICGGFPCQDVSFAGQRAGLKGKRTTLWREMFRLVCEIRPRWVVAENVPGLLSSDDGRFFGQIIGDLAHAGYHAEWGVLSSAGVGAPHLRRRVFILAHAVRGGGSPEHGIQQSERAAISDAGRQGNVANTNGGEFSQSRRRSEGRTGPRSSSKDVPDAKGARGGRLHAGPRAEGTRTPNTDRHRQDVPNSDGERLQGIGEDRRAARSARLRRGAWRNENQDVSDTTDNGLGRRKQLAESGEAARHVANTTSCGRSKRHPHAGGIRGGAVTPQERRGSPDSRWWITEPNVGRVVDGVSTFMDRIGGVPIESAPEPKKGKANAGKNHRLRGLGNAVNPYNAIQVGEIILNYEKETP